MPIKVDVQHPNRHTCYQILIHFKNKNYFLCTKSLCFFPKAYAFYHINLIQMYFLIVMIVFTFIYQFRVDSNVYFQFHSFYFLLKDYSGKVHHRGYLVMDSINSPSTPKFLAPFRVFAFMTGIVDSVMLLLQWLIKSFILPSPVEKSTIHLVLVIVASSN